MLQSIINTTIHHYIEQDNSFEKEILSALCILLNKQFTKSHLDERFKNNFNFAKDNFEKIFSARQRKARGIYYTPSDVADYIVSNVVISSIFSTEIMFSADTALDISVKMGQSVVQEIIFEKTFFDPTCGSGEFLLSVIYFKIKLAIKSGLKLKDFDYIQICKSVKGNDIERESIDIAKMRIFFAISSYLKNVSSFGELASVLNQCFFDYDFIVEHTKIQDKFDYIVGNPPYVEYSKYIHKNKLNTTHGNIYANVIANSLLMLKDECSLGFVLPISYISTARMRQIRAFVKDKCEKQIILSYADRPDCLFVGAHQKINILIAKKGNNPCKTYTSNYTHWYKNERKELLSDKELMLTEFAFDEFIPKIGNSVELSIYKKISSSYKENLITLQKENGKSLYLNMRACFWIKAFSFRQKSKEYKEFKYDEKMKDFVLCILNSSLFWIYWTMISDCWHLTSKELRCFSVPKNIKDAQIYQKMALNLEKKLEKTKVFIKTAQTDFEYKHKLCKREIDEIDKELAKIYHLSQNELKYIQNYALRYRLGDNSA